MTKPQFRKILQNGQSGRAKILKSAADIFVRKGYHETTVDEVAKAMGVAKGTIYNHFAGKEDLYLAVIRSSIEKLQERLKQAAAKEKNTREKIADLIRSIFSFFEEEKGLVLLFLTEFFGRDARRGRLAAEMLAGCLDVIRSTIATGVAEGTLREVDVEVATYSLFGMVAVAAYHFLNQAEAVDHEAASQSIAEIFFEGTSALK